MMKDALFGGVNAAVLTPMRADLSVDLDRMASHCRWLLANGCNNLGVLGTTGEANSIGISERIEILQGLIARGIPAAKMMPGTGTTGTDRHRAADQAGRGCRLSWRFAAAAVLLQEPDRRWPVRVFQRGDQPRRRPTSDTTCTTFPQQSAVPFSVDLIARLLKAFPGTLKGVKDSSGNYDNGRAYVENFAGDGFEVYAGDDTLLRPLLLLGSAGCITAAANVNSPIAAEVYANWNNDAGARAHETLSATRKAIVSAPAPIPALKALDGAAHR